ncbi:MAG: hypothetical protein JWP25_2820 [Bradyrhizobium sp.]|jgi:hypothetical protein|nr:hypothetical protein [Bradyrhizobium sp.]
MRSIAIALAFALLPGEALSGPATVDKAHVKQETIGAIAQGTVVAPKPATETLRGIIDSVDQGNDTIKIRLSQDKTEQFKVQDALIFNAVRYGDQVEVTVQNIAGAKTIVGLSME